MTENTQAVVDEANAPAKPDAAVDGARDDVESLLAEFDQKTQTPTPEPKTETKPEVVPQWAQVMWNKIAQDEVKKAASDIFEGMELSERTKRGWLDEYARENPAAKAAFDNKDRDPRTWARWQKALKAEVQKEFPNARKVEIDAEATADRNAVAAAVRGASTTHVPAEPAPQLGRMTDAELREYTRKNFGF